MTKHEKATPPAPPAAAHAEQRERAARLRDAAGRFSSRPAEQTQAAPAPQTPDAVPAQPHKPRGSIPRPANAHPDTYGLMVDEDGLGLHAPPGASLLVEPVMPTRAGLAIFHSAQALGPGVFDLTHNFNPKHAKPFAPGSEVMPLVEVVSPITGRPGHIRADKFDAIHRVIGIYVPADSGLDHHRAPKALPILRACPEGMGEHYVKSAAAYPLVRPGETVVFDPAQREPSHGALCVLQWSNGHRDVLLTNHRTPGGTGEPRWFVDPVNRPSSRAMMERQHAAGAVGVLYASDGPYGEEHLRERILGTVVGVLVPHLEDEPDDEPAITALEAVQAAPRADPAREIKLAAMRKRATAAATAIDDTGLTSRVSAAVRDAIAGHYDVLAETEQDDGPEDDATFDQRANAQIAAEVAVARAPTRTLADVRAKLTYLVPHIAPDMLDRMHVEHLEVITADVDRLCRATPANDDGAEDDEETDAEAQARLAAAPFAPVDFHGICPVPTTEVWEHDGKATLPWLRIGWLVMSFDRDKLADHMLSETEKHYRETEEALARAERNFEQLHRFVQCVRARRMIGLAIGAERERLADETGEA